MTDTTIVESRKNLVEATAVEMGITLGNVTIENLGSLERIAHTLSRGGVAVPEHCRNQPGVCFALALQAAEWGMPIMAVINKSYSVNGRIAYESQLIHAVVELRAPMDGRLRHEYLGDGDDMRCRVWGKLKGEEEEFSYESEPLKRLLPREGEKGLKGSPLWRQQPRVQILYHTRRNWARLFVPEVILGAYTREEAEDMVPIDVTPSRVQELADRLKSNRMQFADRGFDPDHVAREASTRSSIIEGDLAEASNVETQTTGEPAAGVDGEQPATSGTTNDAGNPGGSGDASFSAFDYGKRDDAGPEDKRPKSRKAK